MEGMFSFVGIIVIVFGILQIILFFKLWGMTNDIRIIKNQYLDSLKTSEVPKETVKGAFEVGALVVNVSSGKQMRIKEIEAATGKYACYTNGGMNFEGNFDESEIKLF